MIDLFRAAVKKTQGQFVSTAGNENRRWHGTRRICNIGDKGHTQFCSAPNCSLCCIMRTSFDVSLWGKKTSWGRCVSILSAIVIYFRKAKHNQKFFLADSDKESTCRRPPPSFLISFFHLSSLQVFVKGTQS